MSYKNANGVLPQHLLQAIQQYIDGEYIYIPRKESEKLPWGAKTATRKTLSARNKDIIAKRNAGRPVADLAAEYFLSAKAIYKIINMAGNG